jgi:type II secretory pathway pseudopilin PulG
MQFSKPRNMPLRRGFTFLQLLIVISIIAILASIMLGAFGRGRAAAQRSECDVRLKTIAVALDAFKAENGRYPKKLEDLQDKHFLQHPDALRCPAERRPTGSYAEYYVHRGPRDASTLPVLVCPLHEDGHHGAQVFLGRYTAQHNTASATLKEARDVQVERPDGKGPITAVAGMELRGGDRVITGTQGGAVILFADTSTATLQRNANVTVLQTFIENNSSLPFYTIVKQTLGEATYRIKTGSKFDVVTPTATAGARGTQFRIKVNADEETELLVTEGKVLISTVERSAWAPNDTPVTVKPGLLGLLGLEGLGDLLGGLGLGL